ncbi:hypothetical protein [Pseudomonas sp. NPDC088444]|uniref:hypothetical protein n=1 Tax=Pseudomonas sp. NPDC088444 TaxID=3364456 RepID=UPI00384EF891
MIAATFTLVCTGWGILLGTFAVLVLGMAKRLLEISLPSCSTSLVSGAYWASVCVGFLALHFNYVSDDSIGRHGWAMLGFYFGVAVPFALGSERVRSIMWKVS